MGLKHTQKMTELIVEGDLDEAKRAHSEYVSEQLAKATEEPINLSDLIAAKDEIELALDARRKAGG